MSMGVIYQSKFILTRCPQLKYNPQQAFKAVGGLPFHLIYLKLMISFDFLHFSVKGVWRS